MKDIPSVTASEALRALERAGFLPTRVRGSHVVVKHEDGRWTTVPVHRGRDLDKNLLRQILREAELNVDEFVRLLKS